MTTPMTSDSEEHEHKLCYCAGRPECHECGKPMDEADDIDPDALDKIFDDWLEDAMSTSLIGMTIDDERTDKDHEQQYIDYRNKAKAKINRLIDDAIIGFASELKESFRGKIIPYKNDGERQIVEQAYQDWTNAIDDALSNNLSKEGLGDE